MALLSSILAHQPSEWIDYSYKEKPFVAVLLSENSSEYYEVKNKFVETFGHAKINEIRRIQHPFAYGRFQLRKEHLHKKNGNEPKQSRKYLHIKNYNKINEIIEYNCDSRRGGFSLTNTLRSGYGHMLVIKVLDNNFDDRDTHRYPQYLISYFILPSYYNEDLDSAFSTLHLH